MRRLVVAVLAAALGAGCSPPSSPSEEGQRFRWTFDGQTRSATSNGLAALRPGTTMFLSGNDCSGGHGVGLTFHDAPTTTGTFGVDRVSVTYLAPLQNWEAGGNRGAGSVTITTLSSQRVVGTFSFELTPIPFAFGTTRSLRGEFDLTFRDRPIC
jgi:hypothetical protein